MPRIRSKRRKSRKHRGGAVNMEIPKPDVSNTSSSGAIQGTMNKQKLGNQEVANLNKKFSGGGDIVVPQMGQAGDSGNETITGGVAQTLQGGADAEFDNDVHNEVKSDGMPAGGGRRRRKRKTRKRKKTRKKRRKKRKRRRKTKKKKRNGEN
jgi:hypothetical protein